MSNRIKVQLGSSVDCARLVAINKYSSIVNCLQNLLDLLYVSQFHSFIAALNFFILLKMVLEMLELALQLYR